MPTPARRRSRRGGIWVVAPGLAGHEDGTPYFKPWPPRVLKDAVEFERRLLKELSISEIRHVLRRLRMRIRRERLDYDAAVEAQQVITLLDRELARRSR